MDENKRESTPQEQEIDIMERYIEAQEKIDERATGKAYMEAFPESK